MTSETPKDPIAAAIRKAGDSLRETIRIGHESAREAAAMLAAMEQALIESRRPAAPNPPRVKPTVPKPSPATKTFYPDSLFVSALTGGFQTARQLYNKLRASGASASKGTIYARFQRLADDPKSGVEGRDYSYRLKAPVAAPRPVRIRRSALRPPTAKPIAVQKRSEVSREFWSDGVRIVLTIG